MTCATCTHWSPKKAGAMAKHRMAPCSLGKPWTYLAPEHTCDRHKAAAPDVAAARVVWLEKSSGLRAGNGG